MITWGTIVYGAAVSAVFALAAVFLLGRERGQFTLGLVVVASVAGPVGWNAILHSAGNRNFFHDAPVGLFPVSWQDVGSGVWTLAAAAVLLGLTGASARRATTLAVLTAAAAFLVDIYLY